jgi:hypothetical protein
MPKEIKSVRQLESRASRLRKAKEWVPTYEGTHLVREYGKHFKVDYDCALKEVEMLGVLTPEQISNLRAGHEKRRKEKREERNRAEGNS